MTSRFVSAGTISGDGGEAPAAAAALPPAAEPTSKPQPDPKWDTAASKRAAEWEAVQKDLEDERRRRDDARKADVEGRGEQSLYDILQANKAAKQAAFEEQNRIRNQFRALDDDEIDFLDGVRDGRRLEEERVRRETEEQLMSFRKAQRRGGAAAAPDKGDDDVSSIPVSAGAGDAADGKEQQLDDDPAAWGTVGARKRKREREREREAKVKGLAVKRRVSGSEKGEEGGGKELKRNKGVEAVETTEKGAAAGATTTTTTTTAVPPPAKPKLGLVDYGSDDDDDD
ncbi:N-terminal domain of NEFA-interacting nuclear protein NIP30-domain-containing protein [Xylariomycetidae sp. FL2044]|nr:N-terminal domain of NEFA-interacting nuclear protein NIP30-domain-containing protein [Xylariomycetidae sp. FL2044]